MTWDEIYDAADGAGYGDGALRAKDNARHQVRCLAMDLGSPDLDDAECPENAVEDYCNAMEIRFDKNGNIKGLKLPSWIEDIIYCRKDEEFLREDLMTVARYLKGDDIQFSEEQMQKMVMMYRCEQDCNVTMNETLENVILSVLRDE